MAVWTGLRWAVLTALKTVVVTAGPTVAGKEMTKVVAMVRQTADWKDVHLVALKAVQMVEKTAARKAEWRVDLMAA